MNKERRTFIIGVFIAIVFVMIVSLVLYHVHCVNLSNITTTLYGKSIICNECRKEILKCDPLSIKDMEVIKCMKGMKCDMCGKEIHQNYEQRFQINQ